MGRNRKARIGKVVEMYRPSYGTVVGYRNDVRSPRYLVIATDYWGRNPRGAAIWLDSSEFTPLGHTSKRSGIIYRKNQREPERGCECQCCEHINGLEPEPGE